MKVRTFALLLLAGGCSSEAITEMEFCAALAEAECAAVKVHCGVADEEGCLVQREFECQVASRKRLSSGTGFNPVGAGVCLQKASAIYSKSFITGPEAREVETACENSYWGQRKTGDACKFERECHTGDSCRDQVCKPDAPLIEPNDRCIAGQHGTCVAGHVCETPAMMRNAMCVPLPATGMPCSPGGSCREDARCDQDVCVARLPLGSGCLNDRECVLPSAFCDPLARVCATGFQVQAAAPFCQPFRRERPGDAAPRPDTSPRGDAREGGVDAAADAALDVAVDVAEDMGGDTAAAAGDMADSTP